MPLSFTLFDTAIGRCALVWGARGIAFIQLPEADELKTRARLALRFPGARDAQPEGAARRARDAIIALLRGEPRDLSMVPLDMDSIPPFHRRVYEAARAIPCGATMTYGALAARIGAAGAARAVGHALARNPFAIVVPCHRVVAAGNGNGGFSAHGGVSTKLRLLAIEGARDPSAPALPGGVDSAAKSLRRG